jgi:hypothetical protein
MGARQWNPTNRLIEHFKSVSQSVFGGLEALMERPSWLRNDAWMAIEPHLPNTKPGAT